MNDCKNSPERCVLCLDEKRSPVSIQCGHSFCCGCFDVYKSYKNFPWSNKCPLCRNVLREKKKPTKRKYSQRYSESPSATITSVTETQNNSSTHSNNQSAMSQQTNILEEFMTLAANYFDDSQGDDDTSFQDYEALDDAVEYLTQDSDNYHNEEYEAQTGLNFDDSYNDEMNFSTDSEEYYDSQYYDDDYNDYNNYYYFNDEEESYEPPRTRRHVDDYYYDSDEETSYIDVVDDRVAYEVDNFDIDWETVIASDVIIID